tara:strand:- start:180 stop:581 length:402 start_codon:yes stop_codon:yes gene_type:complete
MAAPTPTTYSRQTGKSGFLVWNAVWANSDDMSAVAVIDLSAQADSYTNSLTIERIQYRVTSGIEFTLYFDATSNQFLYSSVLGNADSGDVDATWGGREGWVKTAAGSTGDLVITTSDAASGDEITLIVWYRVS